LFTHYYDTGKCEWIGGELDTFARHYNEKAGTNYALTKCLDIVKVSGVTPKAPEVLLTDINNRRQMVIERKSVAWPKSYLYRHQLEHEFANLIRENAKDLFRDAGYKLSVGTKEFRNLTSGHIRDAGKQIGQAISPLTPVDLPVRIANPITWSFREVFPGEEEETLKGIVVSLSGSMAFGDSDREEAICGLPSQIQVQLDAAAAKFKEYARHVKLVLLDFYCNELWEDDVPPMMEKIVIPDVIDEVWRTIRDWISADDYQIGYDRLFRRLR
jgi:hypothetical protein